VAEESVSDSLVELTGVNPVPQFRDRMTVVEKIYHQPANGEAFCCETTFERTLNDEESVYSRKVKATEEWKPLDYGWITENNQKVGMLVIRNDEGKNIQRLPSDEEKVELAGKILEIGCLQAAQESTGDRHCVFVPLFHILPGESMRGVPANQDIQVRSLKGSGQISYTVFAFPN
jgi:hypothetical protein